jgi:hypothetical protein
MEIDSQLPKELFRCNECLQTIFLGIEYKANTIKINSLCEEYHIGENEEIEYFLNNNFGVSEYEYDTICNNSEHEGEKLIGFCLQCLCGYCNLCKEENEHNLHLLKLNEEIKLNDIEVNYYKITLNHFEKKFQNIELKLNNLKEIMGMEELNKLIDNYIKFNKLEICFAEEILCEYITHQNDNFNYKLPINVRNVLKFNNIIYPSSNEDEEDEDEIFVLIENKIYPFLENKNNFFLKESKLDIRENINIMNILSERNLNLDMKEEKNKFEFKYLRKRNYSNNNISEQISRKPSLRVKQSEISINTIYDDPNSFSIFNKRYNAKINENNDENKNSIHKRYTTEFIKSKNLDTENSIDLNFLNKEDNKSNSLIEKTINLTINPSLEKEQSIIKENSKNTISERKNVTQIMANGKYVGTINKEGKFDGKGIFYFKNGDIYEGGYKNGFREGYGTYKYANGEKFEGDFIKGKADGFGIVYYKNGYYYKGNWKNDLKEGKGEYYNPKTKTITYGVWSKGKRKKN